jgi:Holliday junction resolvase
MAQDVNEREIVEALRKAGVWVIPARASGRVGGIRGLPSGFPDLLCLSPFTLIEVKSEKGKLSKSQEEFQKLCLHYGVPYYVVRTANQALAAVGKL